MFEQSFLKEIGAIVHGDGHVGFADFDPAADPCPDSFITPVPGFSPMHLFDLHSVIIVLDGAYVHAIVRPLKGNSCTYELQY